MPIVCGGATPAGRGLWHDMFASGVPASGASAVLLNVTAVAPTAGTFVTVFPTDVERPLAANLNAQAGQVVPNMVLARLGADGAAAIYNNGGNRPRGRRDGLLHDLTGTL